MDQLESNTEGILASASKNVGLLSGFASWTHCIRFCAVIILFALLLVGTGIAITNYFVSQNEWRVSVNPEGTTVISVAGKRKQAVRLISGNQVWINTGVPVKPGQKININASGKINLGIHRLVDGAIHDKQPRLPWIGPEGDPNFGKGKAVDKKRADLRISDNAFYGGLLAYVHPVGKCKRPSLENFKPSCGEIWAVKGADHRNTFEYSDTNSVEGELYFTVNETVLQAGSEYENAYVLTLAEAQEAYGETHKPKEIAKIPGDTEKRWKYIKDREYWDVWFDDNVGQFLVQINLDVS